MNLTSCIRSGSQDRRPGYLFQFAYDVDAVEALKKAIPHTDREWREDTKSWWVSEGYEKQLMAMFGNFEALIFLQGSLF